MDWENESIEKDQKIFYKKVLKTMGRCDVWDDMQ